MKDIDKDYTPGKDFDSVLQNSPLFEDGFENRVLTKRSRKKVALSLQDIRDIISMADEVLAFPVTDKS